LIFTQEKLAALDSRLPFRQAHDPEQRRRIHGPERSLRTHHPDQGRREIQKQVSLVCCR